MAQKILKIDAMGRVTIPKDVREDWNYVMFEERDGAWVLTPTEKPEVDRYKIAAEVLRELGYGVPEELE